MHAAAGKPAVRVRGIPAGLLRAGGFVSPMTREIAEMSYQWTRPYVLDDSAARAYASRDQRTRCSWRSELRGPRFSDGLIRVPPRRLVGGGCGRSCSNDSRKPVLT